jgi:hypothetical protein
MDFKQYYQDQIDGLNGFRGQRIQRGYGIGSFFKRLARWAIPIIKQHAKPVLTNAFKYGVSEISNGMAKFNNDINNDNKDIKESAKDRATETFNNIKNKIQKGGKRKRKTQKSIKYSKKQRKTHANIFDHAR